MFLVRYCAKSQENPMPQLLLLDIQDGQPAKTVALQPCFSPDGKTKDFIVGQVVSTPTFNFDLYPQKRCDVYDRLYASARKGVEFVYRLMWHEHRLRDINGDQHAAYWEFNLGKLPGVDAIQGGSTDLLFALAATLAAFPKDGGYMSFAATGVLGEPLGAVRSVDCIPAKFKGAIQALKKDLPGRKYLFYPRGNVCDVTPELLAEAEEYGIKPFPLTWVNEALQELGVPSMDLLNGNPYVGSSSFEVKDHKRFCGRDEDIRKLRTELEQFPALLIVAGSGSGRTSLVQAGLIPTLQKHPLNGISMAGYHFLRPIDLFSGLSGEPTIDQLFYALKEKLPGDWSQAFGNKVQQTPPEPIQFAELASHWQPPKFASDGYWLWAVDPLEEIFSYPEAVVEGFTAFWAAMSNKPYVKIVATLRHDYMKIRRNQLNSKFGKWQKYELKPMDGAQLAAIIKTPAERSHYPPVVFEVKDGKSLVDLLREDIAAPEAMPWLQLALFTLFERAYARHQQRGEDPNKKQSSTEIRYEDYEALGKMQGFIVKEANDIFQLLSDDIKKDMPTLMEYLKVGDPVKRRTRDFENNTIQSKINLVNKLIDARLLVLSLSDLDEVLVTLVHDCLLTYIPKEQKFITKKKNSIPKVEMPIVQQFFKK